LHINILRFAQAFSLPYLCTAKHSKAMSKKTFILHDETVNTYGFRMLTSGANLEEFKKNPVMLLNHDDWKMPIGRWENIRIEGTQILADAVFDEADPRAVEVQKKVDTDFIRMASIGAWSEETSDAYDLMLPGQNRPTVTKWTVREASIVTIGANHNALALYDGKGNLINMGSFLQPEPTATMEFTEVQEKIFNQKDMGKLTQVLNLSDTASEADIVGKVNELISNNDRLEKENKTLTAAIDAQKAEQKKKEQEQAIALVDAAVKDGRIDAKGKDTYLSLFDRDFASAKAALEAVPVRQSVTAQIISGGARVDMGDWKNKSWDELDKAGKLTQLKDNHPDIYAEKFEERFGTKPNM
jgi:caudovirus prohead protease